MPEISKIVSKQLINGDVPALTKNGGLDCVTASKNYSNNPMRDTTKIACASNAKYIDSGQGDQFSAGLTYIYERSGSTATAYLFWAGAFKVRERLYTVVIADKNLNGKIDKGEVLSIHSNPGDLDLTPLPVSDDRWWSHFNATKKKGQKYSTFTMTPPKPKRPVAPPASTPEITKAAEGKYQLDLEAAGLLVIERVRRTPPDIAR